jgi:dipeptidyl aminopeptidase/acylaminoacyl peptidase
VTKGRYYSGVIAAVAVLATFACGCGGQDAVDPSGSLVSEEGQIAFMRATSFEGTDIESDIYSINVDGTRERRLTDSPGLDGFPSWSPDGRRLVFATDRADGGNWELYVMDSDGTHQRRLTTHRSRTRTSALGPSTARRSPTSPAATARTRRSA